MNKKIIAAIAVALVVILGVVYFIYQAKAPVVPVEEPIKSEPTPAVLDLKNASYNIDGQTVTLINGKSEVALGSSAATKIITQYFGNEVKADFNSDGHEDTAFLLTQNSGGSGTFYYVAVWLSSGDSYKGTNAMLLGDRIAPQTTEWSNHEIVVNYAERKAGEAMTATPSVAVSRRFQLENGELIEVNAPDLTAGWKIKSNSKYGFSFKYPADFFDANHAPKILVGACKAQAWPEQCPEINPIVAKDLIASGEDAKAVNSNLAQASYWQDARGEKMTINNLNYCLYQNSDAGMGKVYRNYYYATVEDDGQCLIVYFTTVTSNCDFYLPLEAGNTEQKKNYEQCLDDNHRQPLILKQIIDSFAVGK